MNYVKCWNFKDDFLDGKIADEIEYTSDFALRSVV